MKIPFTNIEITNKKAGNSVWPPYLSNPESKARVPKWDYTSLYTEGEQNWVVQSPIQYLISEAMRQGGSLQFRFKSKCDDCGMEYQKEVTKCELCGSDKVRKPEPSHMRRARSLVRKPNSNEETWDDILYSMFYHDAIADRYFLSIGYEHKTNDDEETLSFIPREIYVEDSRYIQPIYDDRLKMGDTPYICQYHYPEVESKDPGNCPICGLPLEKTAYVQKVGDDVKNRFTMDEMVTGSTYRALPDPDPNPRMVSSWQSIHTVKAIDQWYYDAYITGRLEHLLIFEQAKQSDLNSYREGVAIQKQALDQVDAVTGQGRPNKMGKQLWISSPGNVNQINFMLDPTVMRVQEHYLTIISGIMSVWGIQAIYVNAETKGGASSPAVRMEIQNHKIEALQRDKETTINDKLFPRFGIDDVIWKFNPLKQKDLVNESKIQLQQSSTLRNVYATPGLSAEIDETGKLVITGRVEGKEQEQSRPEGTTPQPQTESDATGNLINETTSERDTTSSTDGDNRVEE